MKNIIFLSYLSIWSIDEGKGAQSFNKTINKYINDGWNVYLINPKEKNSDGKRIDNFKNISFKPIFYKTTKIKKIGYFGKLLHSLQGSFHLYKECKKLLNKLNGQAIIYAYEVDSVRAAKRISVEFRLPLVTRFQGTILTNRDNNIINRIRFHPHFHALQTKADITIMTDDGTKGNQVLMNVNNKSSIIKFWRNGVDIQKSYEIDEVEQKRKVKSLKEKYGISNSDKVLVTISRLASWKRVDRAISAFADAKKNIPSLKLIIVGDGEERESLKNIANKLNVEKDVIFVGAVAQKEIQLYLEIADVFLSLYDLSNVGNPLLEAMSCGKAIITLNVGDTKSVISNNYNGILIEPNDLKSIPDHIYKLIFDEKFSQFLSGNAAQYAKENFWSWEDRMNAELEVISNLLDYNSNPHNQFLL